MNPKKIENILKLSDEKRYDFLIEKVADFQNIYLIYGKFQELYTVQLNGTDCGIVFPEKEFAERFKTSNEETVVKKKNVYDFIEYLERDVENRLRFAVFPDDHFNVIVADSKQLLTDITESCKQYE